MKTTEPKTETLTGHTRGRWSAYNFANGKILKKWHIAAGENNGIPIATLDPYPCEEYANARLIAAAPELLEALKLTLRNVESQIYMQPVKNADSTELKSLRKWREIVQSAIAKATGN